MKLQTIVSALKQMDLDELKKTGNKVAERLSRLSKKDNHLRGQLLVVSRMIKDKIDEFLPERKEAQDFREKTFNNIINDIDRDAHGH